MLEALAFLGIVQNIHSKGIGGLNMNITEQEKKFQNFHRGDRVYIIKKLPYSCAHFPKGRKATILYSYADAHSHNYKGVDAREYALDVDGIGFTAWYNESHLRAA